MLDGLKKLAEGVALLVEVRALKTEVVGLREAVARIAAALERRNDHDYPTVMVARPGEPAVEVSYVNAEEQVELIDIELRLTAARGMPPTEEEILVEYERRHPQEGAE